MTHLSSSEFVDAVEQTLDPVREAHVAACASCRDEVAALRETLGAARAVEMPEPSPLFWNHFAARVSDATGVQPMPTRTWWEMLWRPVAAGAMLAGAVALMLVLRSGPAAVTPAIDAIGGPVASLEGDLAADADTLEPLTFIAQLASGLSVEELGQAAMPSANAASAIVEEFSPEQTAELLRLIRAEMGGSN